MHMKKFFLTGSSLLLLLVILGGCGPTQEDFIAYNDAIVEEHEKVNKAFLDFYNALDGENTADMEQSYADMVKQIHESLTAVKNMGPIAEETEFRDAGIALFEYYKSIAENEYRELLNIYITPAEELTMEDQERLSEIKKQVEQGETELFDRFINAQEQYAERHDLQLI